MSDSPYVLNVQVTRPSLKALPELPAKTGGSIPYGTVIFPPPGGPDDAYMRLLRKHGLLVMDPSQWPGWSRVPEIEEE